MAAAASLGPGSAAAGFLTSIAQGLRNIVVPWSSSKADTIKSQEALEQALKRPRLSAEDTDTAVVDSVIAKVQPQAQENTETACGIKALQPDDGQNDLLCFHDNGKQAQLPLDEEQLKDQVLECTAGHGDAVLYSDSSVPTTPVGSLIPDEDYVHSSVPQLLMNVQLLDACVGSHSVQNLRPYQEDRTAFMVLGTAVHMGVYDGHAGGSTSSYLQEHLLNAVYEAAQRGMHGANALEQAFIETNHDLRKMKSAYYCGSTATAVILDGLRITCANTGDSPAFVVGKSGEAICLTLDHNPNTSESERLRVLAAGGRIEKMHWGERNKRVLSYDSLSGLAMTRAFGDFNFPGVICDPHISESDLDSEARYLVIASDGLTEQWTVEEAALSVLELADSGLNTTSIAMEVSNRAMEKGSRDNITVVVFDLQCYFKSFLG